MNEFIKNNEKEIYECSTKYNSDDKYKGELLSKYLKNPMLLSLAEVYLLEILTRDGHKSFFDEIQKEFKEIESEISLSDISNVTKSFKKIDENITLKEIISYLERLREKDKNCKLRDICIFINSYKDTPEFIDYINFKISTDSLNEFEKEIIDIINFDNTSFDKDNTFNDNMEEELIYDDYFLIDERDNRIKDTIANLLLGKAIHVILNTNNPTMKMIKNRQLEPGLIANCDKSKLFDFIGVESLKMIMGENFQKKINDIYGSYLINKNFGNKSNCEDKFTELLKYRTNITVDEVLLYVQEKNRRKKS